MLRRLLSFAVLALAATSLWADELRTLGGKSVTGTLVSITDAEIKLKGAEGEVATPMTQVLALDIRESKGIAPGAKYTDVRLLDDTILHCRKVAFTGKEVSLTLLSGTEIKLPLGHLVWMIQDGQDAGLRRKFGDMLAQKVKRDRIVILRDGELNPLEGTLGEIDEKGTTIQFKRDGADAIGVLFERLHGLIFYRTEAPTETPICRVFDTDGNSLVATKLAYENNVLTVATGFGAKVQLKYETLARLDFNMGKLTFLADVEPSKTLEYKKPLFETAFIRETYLKDLSSLKKPLVIQGNMGLEFNLEGKYKEFKATLGVDPGYFEKAESKATVTIYCDGEKMLSEPVSAKQKSIALSVKDVGTLRIVVTPTSFLPLHSHAVLAEARVSQ